MHNTLQIWNESCENNDNIEVFGIRFENTLGLKLVT